MSVVVPVMVERENTRNVQSRRESASELQFDSKMYLYAREICFLLAILFTSYAALQNGAPKVSKTPAAVPFFGRTSLITDFYQGQLSPAFERVSESDISFVMYYAPWDAESQALRSQFKAVAQYYYKQVYFAAINCWQPLSECRTQFSKIQMFPVLIAYTQHTKGIQYKGIKEAPHMISFLRNLLHPITRVHSSQDIVRLMGRYDAVVVGFFNFRGSLGGPGYHTFYSTALKFLEGDPQREVGFACITNHELALQWDVYRTPSVRLYLWNETLEYGIDEEYSVEAMSKWFSEKTHQVSVWVSPPGVKSLALSPYVEEGSVLILFTPRNPLREENLNYQLLHMVGLDYYNCEENPWVNDLTRWLSILHKEQRNLRQNTERQCLGVNKDLRVTSALITSVHVVADKWGNVSCMTPRRKKLSSATQASCHRRYTDVIPNIKIYRTSQLHQEDDPRSTPSLMESSRYEQCRLYHRAELLQSASEPDLSPEPHPAQLKGSACRTNRTLSLLAMDSLQFGHFARGLGVDLSTRPDATAVVIFNSYDESSYVMEQPLSLNSLQNFIVEYTEGSLNRSRRSSSWSTCNGATNISICVQEITAASFESVVMSPLQHVVVLYYTQYCAYCSSLSHIYLTTSRHFRAVRNITFVRINGDENDLPWQYTMPHYPSILIFPAARKSESRVFPETLPVTVPHLVNFVLANLGSRYNQLEALIGLCSVWDETQDCLSDVKRTCLGAIGDTLTEYRSTVLHWQAVQNANISQKALFSYQQKHHKHSKRLLFKLQHLREVQVLLGSVNSLADTGREFVAIQRSFHFYQNN